MHRLAGMDKRLEYMDTTLLGNMGRESYSVNEDTYDYALVLAPDTEYRCVRVCVFRARSHAASYTVRMQRDSGATRRDKGPVERRTGEEGCALRLASPSISGEG
jgi:hypothetical protein